MVEFNTTEGEIGVYKGHVPMTVIISPGILTISEEEKAMNAALHAGFAEILPDSVKILAEIVEWPEEIDEVRARREADQAREALLQQRSRQEHQVAQATLARALNRLRVKSHGIRGA